MTQSEQLFHEIAAAIPDVKESKMFGALCIKAANGKAGVMFYKENMVFKLPEKDMKKALQLADACIFQPGGRQMNGWVQLTAQHSDAWKKLAQNAMDYVKTLEK